MDNMKSFLGFGGTAAEEQPADPAATEAPAPEENGAAVTATNEEGGDDTPQKSSFFSMNSVKGIGSSMTSGVTNLGSSVTSGVASIGSSVTSGVATVGSSVSSGVSNISSSVSTGVSNVTNKMTHLKADDEAADGQLEVTSDTPPETRPPATAAEDEQVDAATNERSVFGVIGLDSVKSVGSSLTGGFSSVLSYGKQATGNMYTSASGALTKVKTAVEDSTTLIGEFSREQARFISEQTAKHATDGNPPWTGSPNEEALKQKILALSNDERNFLREPPTGAEFEFSMTTMADAATVMLKQDKRLDEMRFLLVPKKVAEEVFWRNYFYRVSLLKQAADLQSAASEATDGGDQPPAVPARPARPPAPTSTDTAPPAWNPPASDFESDAFDADVQRELADYELVGGDAVTDQDLESEIMREIETGDLQ